MTDLANMNEQQLSLYLKNAYKFDLSYFDFSLRYIGDILNLIKLKKKRTQYQKNISSLEKEKRNLSKHIYKFLNNTNLWDDIQAEEGPWSEERKFSYIEDKFNLNSFFCIIDERILGTRKSIAYLDDIRTHTGGKKKSVKIGNLISLVWLLAMISIDVELIRGNTRIEPNLTQIFNDIHELLLWFSGNKPELMRQLFGEQIDLDNSAIKASFQRYIRDPNRSRNQEDFCKLAESICSETFFAVDE